MSKCKYCGFKAHGQNKCGGEFLYQKTKGVIAQEIVAEFFRKAPGFKVIPIGIEISYPYILDMEEIPEIFRHKPDFYVIGPQQEYGFFVEVKYRRGDGFDWDWVSKYIKILKNFFPLLVVCCRESGEIECWTFSEDDDLSRCISEEPESLQLEELFRSKLEVDKEQNLKLQQCWEVAKKLLKDGPGYAD